MPNGRTTPSYLPRPLPPELAGLDALALDLRWNWSHSADRLWQTIDPALWEATGNAWLILESVSYKRLRELAADPAFLELLRDQRAEHADYLSRPTWFSEQGRELGGVAYFSMEFGLGEALPIYSGGLGILAGDMLKTASDLGVPVVGVGLLYHRGYFRQGLDAAGDQLAFYPYNDPTLLPVMPLRDAEGEWLRVELDMPGRTVHLRAWQVQVGRTRLYLLDSNHPLNSPRDRGITGELYGGSPEIRLEQQLILGIGGWRLLEAVEFGCNVCHLNEGHAAFAALERARSFMARGGLPFEAALRATSAGNVFTTHTPVAAAFDRYPPALIGHYLGCYADALGLTTNQLMALGQGNGELAFNMAWLALRCATRVNGVSRLHGEVSRELFAPLFPRWPAREVPIGHVTNGVHMPSWDSAAADRLWTEAGGKGRWMGTLEDLDRRLRAVPDGALWEFRRRARQELIDRVRVRVERQQRARGAGWDGIAHHRLLDPNALTLGFARRFASYKRPDLLLADPERLIRLLVHPQRPVQLVVAGKAHPQDAAGKAMVRLWADFMRRPEVAGRVVFIEDYDIGLAAELVQGVDLWINTPRRPWEASGTSGMKVLVNGGLNLSELDGWWAEAYQPDLGWALGDGREHDADPQWDRRDAEALYQLLEQSVVPCFYDRDPHGVPVEWVQRIRESMARLTPHYSANRMLRQYVNEYYLPAAADCARRCADGGTLGAELTAWRETVAEHWPRLHLGDFSFEERAGFYHCQVQIYLDELEPDYVRVELYAEPRSPAQQSVWPLERGEPLTGATNGYVYSGQVPANRPVHHYTPRLRPFHPEAFVPLEAEQILWMG